MVYWAARPMMCRGGHIKYDTFRGTQPQLVVRLNGSSLLSPVAFHGGYRMNSQKQSHDRPRDLVDSYLHRAK